MRERDDFSSRKVWFSKFIPKKKIVVQSIIELINRNESPLIFNGKSDSNGLGSIERNNGIDYIEQREMDLMQKIL